MDRTASIFLGIMFIIGVAGFLIFLKPNDTVAPTLSTDVATYTNTSYGFDLSYPDTLGYLEYTPEIITIGTLTDSGIDGITEVRVMSGDEIPAQLATLCAADGPTGSFSCSDIIRSEPFTTTSGWTGTEIYLAGELHDFTSDTRTPVEKGPYIILPLTASDSTLVVHAPLNQSAAEAQTEVITAIAKSAQMN